MDMEHKQMKHHEYVFTEAELKEKLGIKGRIISFVLMSGLSPKDVECGVSPDKSRWGIRTNEGDDIS
jgi:hypothetical protein